MKRFALIIAALLALCPAFAGSLKGAGSAMLASGGGGTTYLSAPITVFQVASANLGTATDYSALVPQGNGSFGQYSTILTQAMVPVSVAGTWAQLAAQAPAWSAGTLAVTAFKGTGGATPTATTLTATISSTAEVTDTTHSFTTAAPSGGFCDAMSIQSVGGTWTATPAMISLLFTSTIGQEAPVFGFSGNVAAGYIPVGSLGSGYGVVVATESLVSVVMPVAGTFDKLCDFIDAAPGATGTWTATLYHESSGSCATPSASTLAAGITGASTNYGSDLTHSVHVAAGDCVSFNIASSGTPNAANIMSMSMRWVPDTNYQYPVFGLGTTMSQSSGGTRYYNGSGYNVTTGQSAENISIYGLIPPLNGMTANVENFAGLISTVPGGATARAFHLRSGAAGSLSNLATCGGSNCSIGAAATTASDATSSTVTAGNVTSVSEVNTSTPAAVTYFKYSYDYNVH